MDTIAINNSQMRDIRLGKLLGILVFIRTMPCYLWAYENTIRPVCAILILIVCLLNISKAKWTWWIFSFIAFSYVWATVFVDHASMVTVFNFIAFAFIPVIRKELVFSTYRTFYSIVTFVLLLSIINYILYQLGLSFGGVAIDPLNKLRMHKYMMYPFLVVPMGEINYRFFSIFDEPGVVGTLCALILVGEKLNFKKKSNIIFLVAGLLSMSMFFFVGLALSVALFSNNNKRRLYMFVAIFAFWGLTQKIPVLYDTIWSRLEYNADTGMLAGDNRSGGMSGEFFESIVGSPLFFTGFGSEFAEQFAGEASLKLIIITYGFIFVFFNVLGYMILARREISNRLDWIYFLIFFFATIYQRPGFLDTFSIFLFTMVIYKYASETNVLKTKL